MITAICSVSVTSITKRPFLAEPIRKFTSSYIIHIKELNFLNTFQRKKSLFMLLFTPVLITSLTDTVNAYIAVTFPARIYLAVRVCFLHLSERIRIEIFHFV